MPVGSSVCSHYHSTNVGKLKAPGLLVWYLAFRLGQRPPFIMAASLDDYPSCNLAARRTYPEPMASSSGHSFTCGDGAGHPTQEMMPYSYRSPFDVYVVMTSTTEYMNLDGREGLHNSTHQHTQIVFCF